MGSDESLGVSLYRKYRPQNFSSVVGQKAAVSVLTTSITKGRAGHAYLFSGSRGCGKTSIARIFAKALNCLEPNGFEPCGKCKNCLAITAGESLDVIEIDGASNNGVENIRGLKENVTLAPFSSKYKIYIIDEVHMLSQGAFNALLKTLEEPPEYVVFVMATTEPHKVPVTIRSRCQHIPFHSISPDDIFTRLEYVCKSEGVSAESEALWEISRQADGALRDALSLLEQVIASGEVTLQNVEAVFGAGSRPAFERWLKTLHSDSQDAYTGLKAMFDSGASGVRVFEEMFSLVRNLWLVSKWQGISESLSLSSSEKKFLLDEVSNWRPDTLHSLLNNILRALTLARQGVRPDILLGTFMLSLETQPEVPAENSSPVRPGEVSAAPPAPEKKPEPIKAPASFDSALKEEILSIAHDGDFVIYCALFDARPFIDSDHGLVLDVEHAYCLDRLKVTQNSAKLSAMFGKFGKVWVGRNRDYEECPQPIDIKTPAKTEQPEPAQVFEPEQEFLSEPETPKAQTQVMGQKLSAFDEYRRLLAIWGAKPEIILVKHKEEDESSNDIDVQEGDNDDE